MEHVLKVLVFILQAFVVLIVIAFVLGVLVTVWPGFPVVKLVWFWLIVFVAVVVTVLGLKLWSRISPAQEPKATQDSPGGGYNTGSLDRQTQFTGSDTSPGQSTGWRVRSDGWGEEPDR
jgi:hypothetical protein